MSRDLAPVLENVRKAYRLLYLYQRRVLDLSEAVGQKLGMQFAWWGPARFDRPAKDYANPAQRSAWEMLPLVESLISYCPPASPASGQWMLTVYHVADSGSVRAMGPEPDPLAFPAAESCRSELKLFTIIVRKGNADDWGALWDKTEYPKDDTTPWIGTVSGCDVLALLRTFDLASLGDETALEAAAHALQAAVVAAYPRAQVYMGKL